jgi:hypothetical protein
MVAEWQTRREWTQVQFPSLLVPRRNNFLGGEDHGYFVLARSSSHFLYAGRVKDAARRLFPEKK